MKELCKQNLPESISHIYIERIKAGKLRFGERIPPIRSIADEFKVSASTAAAAVQILVRSGWLVSRHGSGCFVNNDLKAILGAQSAERQADLKKDFPEKGHPRKLFFFIDIDNASSPYAFLHTRILCAIQQELEKLNWQLKICRFSDQNAIEEACRAESTAGVIYMPDSTRFPYPVFKEHGVKEVLFGMSEKDNHTNYVLPDNYAAGYDVAKYVYAKGHRKIVFVNAFPAKNIFLDKHFKFRLNGVSDYFSSVGDADLQILRWNVNLEGGTREIESFFAQLSESMNNHDLPTVMIVAGHSMAAEIWRYAASVFKGCALSERLSIITFEESFSPESIPVSYAAIRPETMAKETVALLKRCQEPEMEDEKFKVLIGMHITDRGSVKAI